MNKIKVENMMLKEENTKNKNEIISLKKQKEENYLERTKYKDEINDLKKEINELNQKLEEENLKNDDYANQNKNLTEQLNRVKDDKIKLNNQIRKLNNKSNEKTFKIATTMTEPTPELLEKDMTINKNNRLISELNNRINSLLKQNKDKEETIKKITNDKEKDSKILKDKIKLKDESINKLNEKINSLSKKQIIEHRTIVDDDEFNSLVDENEDLKTVNNELVEKLNFLMRQRKDINYSQNESIIMQQKEEINALNKKYNQLYYELNQYKDKNNELNRQIRSLKNGMK